jgi:hypothetical protein
LYASTRSPAIHQLMYFPRASLTAIASAFIQLG